MCVSKDIDKNIQISLFASEKNWKQSMYFSIEQFYAVYVYSQYQSIQTARTKCLNWLIYKQYNLLLEARKFKVKVLTNLVFGKGSFLIDSTFLLCLHTSGLPLASFVRTLIPFTTAKLSWLNHLPKAPPLHSIILKIRLQYVSLRNT
jgi:hypothetical protein